MPERIVTDESGDRWDVQQDGEGAQTGVVVFRHQSGRRVTLETERPLDALSNEELLRMLKESGRESAPGEGPRRERSADPEGYVTRPEAPDRP